MEVTNRDDPVPQAFSEIWSNYYLLKLRQIKIPKTSIHLTAVKYLPYLDFEIRHFRKAIWCVYETEQKEHKSHLVCSKSNWHH